MVSTRPFISKSFSTCSRILVTIPRPPITIGIIVTLMFHIFFNSLARSRNLSFFRFSFNFTLSPAGTAKSTIRHIQLFLVIILRSGRLTEIKWSACISKYQKSLYISFSRTDSRLCIYRCLHGQIIIIIVYSLRVFLISFSWWSFTRDRVTASVLKSPGLFSVFCPFSTML